MDVREKLIELLQNAKAAMKSENLSCDIARNMFVVDFMMANGVTVQECKLGDKIYQTDGVRIYESIIGEITLTAKHTIFVTENIAFDERAIGNSIFLSYAEAEAHLLQQPAEENKNGV